MHVMYARRAAPAHITQVTCSASTSINRYDACMLTCYNAPLPRNDVLLSKCFMAKMLVALLSTAVALAIGLGFTVKWALDISACVEVELHSLARGRRPSRNCEHYNVVPFSEKGGARFSVYRHP